MLGRRFGQGMRALCRVGYKLWLWALVFLYDLALGFLWGLLERSEPVFSAMVPSESVETEAEEPARTIIDPVAYFPRGAADHWRRPSSDVCGPRPVTVTRWRRGRPRPASSSSSWEEVPPKAEELWQEVLPENVDLQTVSSMALEASVQRAEIPELKLASMPQSPTINFESAVEARAELFERFLRDLSQQGHPCLGQAAEIQLFSLEPAMADSLVGISGLNRWQRLVLVARQRRCWSEQGRQRNYQKKGMPK